MEAEVMIAQKIQRSLLPASPFTAGWCGISGTSVAAAEDGGDYFDIIKINDDEVLVVVADASGHGTGAGILSAMTKSGIMQELQHSNSPGEILTRLNATIARVSEKNMFVTCALALVSRSDAIVSTAGHPPLFHYSGGRIVEIRTPNVALGLKGDARFSEIYVPLSSGDLIFLYTDGVTEARGKDGSELGMEQLKTYVVENLHGAKSAIDKAVIEHVRAFSGELSDDATVVAIQIV